MDKKLEKFWSQVDKDPGGCWLWTGPTINSGYGNCRVNSVRLAHRVSWTLEHGPIPDGLQVLHVCPDGDNKLCVNPAHLFLGTQRTNLRDAQRKGCLRRGESHPAARLFEEEVRCIRRRYAEGGTSCHELGRKYGVSHEAIRKIVRKATWAHV